MRTYIADDVRYLSELGRLVSAAVVAADIVEEVQLDCERLTDEAVARPAVATFGLKVPRTLPAADQAFQSAAGARLHALRLAWAEAADVPMGRMLSNAAIQELVTKPPADRHALSRHTGRARPGGARARRRAAGPARRAAGSGEPGRARGAGDPGARPEPEAARGRAEGLPGSEGHRARGDTERGAAQLAHRAARGRPSPDLEALARVPYLGEKRTRLYGEAVLRVLADA